jgi:hypothetical protein
MGDSLQPDGRRSRRAVLAAAAGGAAALAVNALRPSAIEAAATNMQTETDNATVAPTGVTNATADSEALFGHATAGGIGVEGTTLTGTGVLGESVSGTGVEGNAGPGMGVLGRSTDTTDPASNTRNAGVVGVAGDFGAIPDNIGLSGIFGYADASPTDGFVGTGVWGDSPDWGIAGTGSGGVSGYGFFGVVGIAGAASGIGVYAAVDDPAARALRVEGRAEFTRSGRTTVKAGKASRTVTLSKCTSSTLVLAVLSNNRSGRYVRAVVPAAGQFTIYLNNSVSKDTSVTWIAFTNPSNHSG